MNPLIDSIVAAAAAGASDEVRAAGAQACRTLLAALEAKEGEPLAAPVPTTAPPAISPEAIPQLLAMMKQMDVNQLLDVAIERLRALNATRPGSAIPEPPRALRFQFVPIPAAPKKAR